LFRPCRWCEVKNTPVTAVAAALLAVPASQAAVDDAGMQYTSAAEGFYGSLRVGFTSTDAPSEDSASIDQISSRLGVRGTADLGGGLSASYRYEFSVRGDNGAQVVDGEDNDDGIGNTRLQNIGLHGGFGSLLIGTQWALDYNYVWGTTDVMNFYSGNHAYNANRAGRQSNAITYTSPDFNGFSFGASAVVDKSAITVRKRGDELITPAVTEVSYGQRVLGTAIDASDPATYVATTTTLTAATDRRDAAVTAAEARDDSEADTIDKWVVAAGYSRAGFDVGGTYVRRAVTTRDVIGVAARAATATSPAVAESITTVDTESNPATYGVSFGYGQDNWSLDYWYGRTDYDDMINSEDTLHSFAGQLGVGKTTLRVIWDRLSYERDGAANLDYDTDSWTLGAQYDLGSRTRVFAEIVRNQENTSDANVAAKVEDTDIFMVGYRVDF